LADNETKRQELLPFKHDTCYSPIVQKL
jgi:hypothetical protein